MKNTMLLISLFSTAAISILFTGCLHSPVAPRESSDFIEDFEEIWFSYQWEYPLFMYREINWLEVGNEYYYLVNQCTTREDFYLLLEDLLGMFQDSAICFETYEEDPSNPGDIAPPESWVYPWQKEYTSNVDYDVLVDNYLQQYGLQVCTLGVACCDPELLPYLMIDHLPADYQGSEAMQFVDSFISLCNSLGTPAIILDLRVQNQRGTMSNSLPGRFTESTYTSVILRSRAGPDYWNYYDVVQAVKRSGPEQFTGTVYVLMGEQNCGAAEILCAELSYNPKVVLVGDQTMGSVSIYGGITTTSNIHVRVPQKTVLMRDGTWLEGVGVPVDVYVETTPGDFTSGVDPILEYAIEQLEQYR